MTGIHDLPPEVLCMVFIPRMYHPPSFVDASFATLIDWTEWNMRIGLVLLQIRHLSLHGCRVSEFTSDAPVLRATPSSRDLFDSPVPYWACAVSELRILGGWTCTSGRLLP